MPENERIAQATLDSLQMNELQVQGFTITDVLPAAVTDELLAVFERLHIERYNSGRFTTTMAIPDAVHRAEADNLIKQYIAPYAKGLLPEYRILFANFLHKPSGEPDSKVGIHRDWTYVDETECQSYNLWIPLVDINEETGLFYALPGSHLIDHGLRATPFLNELDRFSAQIQKLAIPLKLKAGQGLLYHSGLIHFTDPNLSKIGRTAVGMVLIPTEAQALHFERTDKPAVFNKYETDESFYYEFDPNKGVHLAGPKIDIQDTRGENQTGKWLRDQLLQQGKIADLIAEYYDQFTASYLETYGEAIQAFRPASIKDLYQYLQKSIVLKSGMNVLDAGCGVGGPALYFAQHSKLSITGITLSAEQVKKAEELKKKKWWLKGDVHFQKGDYHQLDQLFCGQKFDAVLYLESLGHSYDLGLAIEQAWNVLTPGGFVYIKDFFPFEHEDPVVAAQYRTITERINAAYAYNVLDLQELLSLLRRRGFEIGFIKKFDFQDDITARAAFESVNKIELFPDMPEFRVAEWLEIKCFKPQ
jgi:cyclopropane fatty-acyl-phospholipid synthase-like methyltransferase